MRRSPELGRYASRESSATVAETVLKKKKGTARKTREVKERSLLTATSLNWFLWHKKYASADFLTTTLERSRPRTLILTLDSERLCCRNSNGDDLQVFLRCETQEHHSKLSSP